MQKRILHHITGLFLLIVFISPFLIKSYHDVFEHTYEKQHKHDILSYCNDDIEHCTCRGLVYFPLQSVDSFTVMDFRVSPFFGERNFFYTSVYTSKKIISLKGRSPPFV